LFKLQKRSELLLRRRSLSAWAEEVAGLSPARHHQEWIAALEDKSVRRLLIIAPPGHAKTSWVSIYYPAWRIGSDPNLHFCLLSNTATQAHRPSVAARELIKNSDAYHKIFPQVKPDYIKGWAEHEWFVQRPNPGDKDATMIAAGVFGPILGARIDELILDDCVDQENSATARQREKFWEWVKATAISRLTPDGRIICVMTRWHERDLAAELIAMGGFRVIHMPALGYYGEGQALWPEVWPVEKLEEKRRDQGSLRFEGMYQGNPTIPEGSILKRAWWQFEHELPDAYEGTLQVWDTAFRESEEADFSVCVTMSVLAGQVYVRGVFRERLAWPDLVRALHSQYERFVPRIVLIEDRASGQSLLQALRSENIPVIPIKADKSKLARTTAISGFVEAGRVHLPRNTSWGDDLVEECAAFPKGAHDDQVDALVHGLSYLFLQQEQEVVVELDPYGLENQISPELDEADGYF
jgi:predicted phage terminase large subunit-like protein